MTVRKSEVDVVQEFVLKYLVERGAEIDLLRPLEYDFIRSGVIDSFETLSFLLVLREEFGVEIHPEDFVDNDYCTVGNLVSAIKSNWE